MIKNNYFAFLSSTVNKVFINEIVKDLKRPSLYSLNQEWHMAISSIKPDIKNYVHGGKLNVSN